MIGEDHSLIMRVFNAIGISMYLGVFGEMATLPYSSSFELLDVERYWRRQRWRDFHQPWFCYGSRLI